MCTSDKDQENGGSHSTETKNTGVSVIQNLIEVEMEFILVISYLNIQFDPKMNFNFSFLKDFDNEFNFRIKLRQQDKICFSWLSSRYCIRFSTYSTGLSS